MENKIYYKIVEIKNNKYYTLFHGINGSRKLKPNVWISAVIKENVQDGQGTKYTSGIHLLENYDETVKYLSKFKNKNNKTIVRCYADGLRKKEHSNSNVFLANKILIFED